jgi:hypothetical protein
MVLCADDTNMIVTGSNPVQFSTEISTTFDDINEWFGISFMYLNYEKRIIYNFKLKIVKSLI